MKSKSKVSTESSYFYLNLKDDLARNMDVGSAITDDIIIGMGVMAKQELIFYNMLVSKEYMGNLEGKDIYGYNAFDKETCNVINEIPFFHKSNAALFAVKYGRMIMEKNHSKYYACQ